MKNLKNKYTVNKAILCIYVLLIILVACKHQPKDEQIRSAVTSQLVNKDSILRSIQGNISFSKLTTTPNSVILTGLADHRLVSVYLLKSENTSNDERNSSAKNPLDIDGSESSKIEHFMPGFDVLFGFYLMNIAHYDMKSGKLNLFFDHPVLIKTLYFPSFIQDSVKKTPIIRDTYLVSVYDEDTNKDGLINRKDLRRFYLFDASSIVKTQLIPADYSVERSQYDAQNDVMYLFARQDINKNGTGDKTEPLHIFWINLKTPLPAKRLY